jgi:hypothetical protein
MVRLLDSGLTNPEYSSFLGHDAKWVADVALTATATAAVLTIPAVFLHASTDSVLRAFGDALGIAIWLVFLAETLIMIRLHHGWGREWLRSHKLQLAVVLLANPLLVWAIGRYQTLEMSTLLPLPSFVQSAKVSKLFKASKLLKFLHLGEVSTKARGALSHVPWLVNGVLVAAALLALGIIGTVIDGRAATPAHGLDEWIEIGRSIFAAADKVLLATLPAVVFFAAAIVTRRSRSMTVG